MGMRGRRGETGPQGARGETGPQGETGERGPQGEVGETGPQGDRGPQGEPGLQGPAGEQGPAGADGEQGPAGGVGSGRHYNMVLSENNYSSIRKKDVNARIISLIHRTSNTSIHRSTARHQHSHVGLLSEYNPLSLRGASRAYVDERIAALLAMIVDLQAQIGG